MNRFICFMNELLQYRCDPTFFVVIFFHLTIIFIFGCLMIDFHLFIIRFNIMKYCREFGMITMVMIHFLIFGSIWIFFYIIFMIIILKKFIFFFSYVSIVVTFLTSSSSSTRIYCFFLCIIFVTAIFSRKRSNSNSNWQKGWHSFRRTLVCIGFFLVASWSFF